MTIRRLVPWFAASTLCGLFAAACSAAPQSGAFARDLNSEGFENNPETDENGSQGGATNEVPDLAIPDAAPPPPEKPTTADAACAAQSTRGELKPLNIHFMIDVSGSMSEPTGGGDYGDPTKLDAVKAGLTDFFKDPSSQDLFAGLAFFPVSDGSSYGDSCTVADYTKPKQAIGLVKSTQSKLISTVKQASTTGATPTSPALQGAIKYVQSYLGSHPDEVGAVIFVTDGMPTTCSPTDMKTISKYAADGLKKGVPTYVLGVFSDYDASEAQANLDMLAKAGGSDQAVIISSNGDVATDLTTALAKIRGQALPCSLKIPTPAEGTLDYGAVNVKYTASNGQELTLSAVDNAGLCTQAGTAIDGWYYDVPPVNGQAPTSIMLCPKTCATIKADSTGGQIDVLLGCATEKYQPK